MLNKKILTIKKILPLFIFVLALVATSSGNTEPPVPWWRGNEGTTFQEWSFSTPDETPPPDTVDNDYGQAKLEVKHHVDIPWFDREIIDSQGVWALSGEIDVVIDNVPEPNPVKEIWITLRWMSIADEESGLPFDEFLPFEPLIAVTPFDYMDMSREYDDYDLQTFWHKSVYVVTIWPNPPKEWITIKGNILVDSLLIETYCVPEPATIAILTIGGLWAIRRRKFKS